MNVIQQSQAEERREHEPIGDRLAYVAFDPPGEMKDRKCRRQIGEAMELLPPEVAEAS